MSTIGRESAARSGWPAMSPAIGVGAGLIVLAYLTLFYRWFERQGLLSWDGLQDWGHAFVIPVISAFFVWRNREQLKRAEPRAFWPGLAPLLLGIMSYFYGVVAIQSHMIEGFAVLLSLFGLTLLLLGPSVMRWLFIPIAYLIFGITLAEIIMINVTFRLQMLASEGSWVILGTIGAIFDFAVDLEGNTLHIHPSEGGSIPLNVAEACSGMRMVVAFYALSVWVALTWCEKWWQRIALFLMAGPVAVFMNMIRVAVLGLLSLEDPNLAAGQAHTLIGTLLLVPSLGMYLGLAWVLNKLIVSEDEAATKGQAAKGQAAKGGAS